MKKRKKKTTPEERAAARARDEDLTRRLQRAIAHYRARAEGQRRLRGEADRDAAVTIPVRKGWREMNAEERVAERARSKDLDRRLLAAIERYRRLGEEKRHAGGGGSFVALD